MLHGVEKGSDWQTALSLYPGADHNSSEVSDNRKGYSVPLYCKYHVCVLLLCAGMSGSIQLTLDGAVCYDRVSLYQKS